jgi:adenylate kinase
MTQGFILMGCPGAGKGTLGAHLNATFGYANFSSGDILRHEVRTQTAIGREVKAIVDRGGQVEDSLIIKIVLNKIEALIKEKTSFVFDGFPQTKPQQEALSAFSSLHTELKLRYIFLTITPQKALGRMINRMSCDKCEASYSKTMLQDSENMNCKTCDIPLTVRSCDAPEKAADRLETFAATTKPLMDAIVSDVTPLIIDGDQTIATIREQANTFIASLPPQQGDLC